MRPPPTVGDDLRGHVQSSGDTLRGAQVGNLRIRRGRRTSQEITIRRPIVRQPRRPGVLLLIVGFVVLIVVGTALLMLPVASESREGAPFLRALFTATSAVCVTGLAVIDTRDTWSAFGEAVIMLLIQLGGLGFMTSATLLLMVFGRRVSVSQRVTTGEVAGQLGAIPVQLLVRRIVLATLAIEAAGAAVLIGSFAVHDGALGLEQIWRGLFTAVSAFNNAGFDIEGGGRSLTEYGSNPGVLGGAALLTFLGGIGYAVWSEAWRTRGWRRLQLNTKIVLSTSAVLILVGAVVMLGSEAVAPGMLHNMPLAQSVPVAIFESIYARTSGFTAFSLAEAHDETLLVLIALMFIGGASGSTAGGVKMNTFTVLFFTIIASVRGDEHVKAFNREISWRQVNCALSVALLSVAIVAFITFMLAIMTDAPFIVVLFEVVSAFATCGLSVNFTGTLDGMSQWLLIVTMFIGRLGPLTFAIAIAERFERHNRLRYAQGEINIG